MYASAVPHDPAPSIATRILASHLDDAPNPSDGRPWAATTRHTTGG
ncbi:hypothetical protein BN13_1050006 [Nostocoides jenkinsii Ben 74]|uniref:Uncharacterized protein n=1 Tax=Nostocoides jenkinsii Ben 74 TaxID=1193518 RepID=A0A077M6Q5_9MICO|nr:hypothetical protein BN13_1050006 [Tetrasphaera jenkinsii Ben 74]